MQGTGFPAKMTSEKRLQKFHTDDVSLAQVWVASLIRFPGGGGGGLPGFMFAGYVPLASQSPHHILVYFSASYRPHLSHFLENIIFAIPTYSLSIYASTLSIL